MKKIFITFVVFFSINILISADLPDDPVVFPQDDYGHQDNPAYYPSGIYAEWWYFNGQLRGYSTATYEKRNLGFFISFHQFKIGSPDNDAQRLLSGITDLDNQKYYFTDLFSKDEPFKINTVSTNRLYIHYMDMQNKNSARLQGLYLNKCAPAKTAMQLKSRLMTDDGETIKLDLALQPINDPLLVNGGKIDMPGFFMERIPNGESVYIAKTKLLVFGRVKIGDETIIVNSFRSEAWFDHQYGDFLGSDSTGWEWISVRLDTSRRFGYELYGVIYAFIQKETKEFLNGAGSFILPGGEVIYVTIDNAENWIKEIPLLDAPGGYAFPLKHTITIPELDLRLEIESSLDDQYADNLYEGHCNVTAVYNGKNVSGFAYKELVY